MGDILGKLTFRFLIGQLIPGLFIVVSGIAFQMLTARTVPITPGDIWTAYSAAIKSLVDMGALTMFAAGAGMGLVLQGISSATEANIESFRKFIIDEKGNKVDLPPEKTRRRSLIRKISVTIWLSCPLGITLLIAPFLATFDVVSVAAARPRNVYKTLHIFRTTTESCDPILGDYLYISTYFANTSIAILLVLIVQIVLLLAYETTALVLIVGLALYLCLGLHYLLWRTTKISLDHALVPLLAPEKRC